MRSEIVEEAIIVDTSYGDLIAIRQCDSVTERRNPNVREVWIYPRSGPTSLQCAEELLDHLANIDEKELVECDARLNSLVTEFLRGRDAREVHFSFSVKAVPSGYVVAVVFGTQYDTPLLEGISLESSE